MSIKQMAKVWEWSKAEGNARLVMLALADFCDDEGYCFPGMARIALKCRISERTVQRIVVELQDMGEVTKEVGEGMRVEGDRGPGFTNLYHLTLERGRQFDGASEGGDKTPAKAVTKPAKGPVTALSPNPPVEPPAEPPAGASAVCLERDALVRIEGFMGRKPTTGWSPKEKKALKAAAINPEDLALVEEYYRRFRGKDGYYCRREILTLLNNWRGEVDKVKEWMARNPKRGKLIEKAVATPAPPLASADGLPEIPFLDEPEYDEAEIARNRAEIKRISDEFFAKMRKTPSEPNPETTPS